MNKFKSLARTNLKCPICGSRMSMLGITPQEGTYTSKGETKPKDMLFAARCQVCATNIYTPLNEGKSVKDVDGRCILTWKK